MNAQLLEFFPIPVLYSEYEKAEEFKKEIIPSFHEYEKNNPLLDQKYSNQGYTSFFTSCQDILSVNKKCKDLVKFINEQVLDMHIHMDLEGVPFLQNSWFSINRKHSFHERHHHLPSIYSGVYYVQSQEDDASLLFVNQNLDNNWPYVRKKNSNNYNEQSVSVVARTGVLWIFPSFAWHKVAEQLTNNERITIAFNFGINT